jgi:porphobilinogen deaminase
MSRIVLGSRGSKMALIQLEYARKQLQEHFLNTEVQTKIITTDGDLNQGDLKQSGGKGAFISALDRALLKGEIDILL